MFSLYSRTYSSCISFCREARHELSPGLDAAAEQADPIAHGEAGECRSARRSVARLDCSRVRHARCRGVVVARGFVREAAIVRRARLRVVVVSFTIVGLAFFAVAALFAFGVVRMLGREIHRRVRDCEQANDRERAQEYSQTYKS